jgi:hypothetical protein
MLFWAGEMKHGENFGGIDCLGAGRDDIIRGLGEV